MWPTAERVAAGPRRDLCHETDANAATRPRKGDAGALGVSRIACSRLLRTNLFIASPEESGNREPDQ
jgi:hypothetical protein